MRDEIIENKPTFPRKCLITDSSNIHEVMYDLEFSLMRIEFVSGGFYEYQNVFPEQFGDLVSRDRPGVYFNHLIKDCNLVGRKLETL